jgi:hypothetical protein
MALNRDNETKARTAGRCDPIIGPLRAARHKFTLPDVASAANVFG